MSVVDGIYSVIVAETSITDGLSLYEGLPAVFSVAPAPVESNTTFITITQSGGTLGNSDRCHRGSLVNIDINLWGTKDDSTKELDEVATNIWKLLDRNRDIVVPDFAFVKCSCNPPVYNLDPEGFKGFRLLCDVWVWY